jgi:hypothetical protein
MPWGVALDPDAEQAGPGILYGKVEAECSFVGNACGLPT